MTYYVYLLSSKPYGTLYIGATNNLVNRVMQHKQKKGSRFTSDYSVHQLVYYEEFGYVYEAIAREKQLKNWKRQWKIDLINSLNPQWIDLSLSFY